MMKCDMCYDRSSVGKKPMCATVCPSQALFFGTRAEIERLRPLSAPVNTFRFGRQTITTRVFMMAPKRIAATEPYVDVTAVLDNAPRPRMIPVQAAPPEGDPFASVEVRG
jgi:Fe-S-cluster-containing dehydrogenase component